MKRQAICTVRFTDEHAGFIGALAGIAVAIFTLTLKWSTDKLWIAHTETHEAAQRAFVCLDGFDYELTTEADAYAPNTNALPGRYQPYPDFGSPGLLCSLVGETPAIRPQQT
jgi:hypothetical protein